MRHGYAGRKLKRTASHRKAMLANMATSLFEHKRLLTTVAKAKELREFAEHLITRARKAYSAERSGTISGVDVHNRRMVGRYIRNKAVLQELFDTIAPVVAERNGGYTRITKLGQRRGDQAPEAMIELVDWSNPQDGRVSSKTRKTRSAKPAKPAGAQAITDTVTPNVAAADVAAADAAVADVAVADVVEETAAEAPSESAAISEAEALAGDVGMDQEAAADAAEAADTADDSSASAGDAAADSNEKP